MPPPTPAPGGTFRRTLLAVSLIVVAFGLYGFFQLGPFLAKEDALQQADAILVLSGTPMRRPLEAADLYLAGYAPRIVLTRQTQEGGERALAARGIPFAEDVERTRDAFLQLGIPDEAIIIPQRIHDSTAAEAITLRELAARHEEWDVIGQHDHTFAGIAATNRYSMKAPFYAAQILEFISQVEASQPAAAPVRG